MAKTVIKCGGVTLAVENVGPEVHVTVVKGPFVFTQKLDPETAEALGHSVLVSGSAAYAERLQLQQAGA